MPETRQIGEPQVHYLNVISSGEVEYGLGIHETSVSFGLCESNKSVGLRLSCARTSHDSPRAGFRQGPRDQAGKIRWTKQYSPLECENLRQIEDLGALSQVQPVSAQI